MHIALEDGQAEQMRTNTADQHVVTVVGQMLHGNGGADIGSLTVDEGDRIGRGDVLDHQLQ